MKDNIVLAIFSYTAAVLIVLIFVALAWYLLWVLVLRRFKFVKDLLNSARKAKDSSPDLPKAGRTKLKKTRKD